ncbi:replication initiation protein RepC, partial [Rhizobium sp. TRM95111]|uniref:plasmid replication protein RepC n=1 Tax=Rhizobium alarense TaxID=2846851 RepID=UPI001F2C3C90
MQTHEVTTPFGRRRMTLALVKTQLDSSEIPVGKSVDKWKVFRDVCEARALLGLRDRALSVLNALLSFYPDTHLSADNHLVVFPSNAQLSVRAHGIAGTTLRENLALLVQAGLVHRRDSPNGKRYARKNDSGAIDEAYGFSLAPLVTRAEELAQMAQAVEAERREIRIRREQVTILRRDIRKLLSAAMEEGVEGDWTGLEARYVRDVGQLGQVKSLDGVESVRTQLAALRAEIVILLEKWINSSKSDGNANDIRHHKQNSNTESINELEPSFETQQAAT